MGFCPADGQGSVAYSQAQGVSERRHVNHAHFGLGQQAQFKQAATCAGCPSDGNNAARLTKREFGEGHSASLV